MRFIDQAKTGKNGTLPYVLTVTLIVLSYIIGGTGLIFDYSLHAEIVRGSEISMNNFTSVLGQNRVLFWLMIPFVCVFVAFLLSIKHLHKRKLKSIFTGRSTFDWRRVFVSFGMIILFLVLTTCIEIQYNDSYQWNFDASKFYLLLIIAVLLIPIQTTIEELVFRGYLMQGLKLRTGSNKHAVILSGIMFGLMHFGNPEIEAIGNHVIIYYVVTGIFLGSLALFDNGLELSIGYHAANNVFMALIISNDWQVFQTNALYLNTSEPGLGWMELLLSLSIFPVLFLIYKKIFKWSSLKETWNEQD